MITKIEITLESENAAEVFCPEWVYRLYAGFLKELPGAYAEKLHNNTITPVSQFLRKENGKILWTVNLLGEEAETYMKPVLLEKRDYEIPQKIHVTERKVFTVKDVDTLFAMASASGKHRLRFVTPTAFKSQGQYTNFPSISLCFKSLVRKWNACFPEVQIEDEDGEGIDTLAAGLFCPDYRLHGTKYTLKGTCIHGFCGEMILKNNLKGFQRELADAVLFFSQYSGIGIKTTLGMGGVVHSFL